MIASLMCVCVPTSTPHGRALVQTYRVVLQICTGLFCGYVQSSLAEFDEGVFYVCVCVCLPQHPMAGLF